MSDRDYEIQLPDPIPNDALVVDREEHRYQVNVDNNGDKLTKDEYTLEKAPVDRIETVTGRRNGDTVTFTKGLDYELSSDGERLVWLNNRRPDDDALFYVSYTAPSIIGRFNDSTEEEMHTIDHFLQEIQDSKFIDTAEGDELDEIGKIFGDNLGKRRGRDDSTYRLYLKSVVQSVISRGTVPDIKEALSAATGIPTDDIVIDEDFVDVEYDIILNPTSPLRGSTIEDIAEVADPSGVELDLIRFRPQEEEVAIEDTVDITISNEIIDEEVSVDDAVGINTDLIQTADEMQADDDQFIDRNLTTIAEGSAGDDVVFIDRNLLTINEGMAGDDAATIDGNLVTVAETGGMADTVAINRVAITETGGMDDAVTTSITRTAWDVGSWDDMNWAKEHN